jgi:hypothetical protein
MLEWSSAGRRRLFRSAAGVRLLMQQSRGALRRSNDPFDGPPEDRALEQALGLDASVADVQGPLDQLDEEMWRWTNSPLPAFFAKVAALALERRVPRRAA